MSVKNLHVLDSGILCETFLSEHSQGGLYAIDCETEGIDPTKEAAAKSRGQIVCWSLAWDGGCAFILGDLLPLFKDWIESDKTSFVGHNIFGFDYHLFRSQGITLTNIVGCTMHMSKQDRNTPDVRHGLKPLAKELLGETVKPFKELFSRLKAKKMYQEECKYTWRKIQGERVPTIIWGEYYELYVGRELLSLSEIMTNPIWSEKYEVLKEYAVKDAIWSLQLFHLTRATLSATVWIGDKSMWDFYQEIWNPSLYALVDMEEVGFALDGRTCYEAVKDLTAEAVRLKTEIDTWTGKEVNWNSYKQVREYIYGDLSLPVPPVQGTLKAIKRVKKGELPTSEAALIWLSENTDAKELSKVITYKKSLKDIQVISSLPERVDEQGRLHCSFSPSTDTGRLAVRNPSINCIKKGGLARAAFVAGPGRKLIVADYSSLEPRILAHFLAKLFDDFTMVNDILAGDLYEATVNRYADCGYNITRDMAKVIVLSINYGKSAKGLAIQLGIPVDEAEYLLELFYEVYPVMVRWQIYCESFALNNGYIKTLMGRIRWIPEIQDQPYRGTGYRKSINTPIQGSAADLVTMAMLKCYTGSQLPQYRNKELALSQCRLIGQVHDELIFEVPECNAPAAMREVVAIMENPMSTPLLCPTPVKAVVCDTWLEGK